MRTADPLHKAVFHHRWTSAKDRAQHWTLVWKAAQTWLIQNKAWKHYLNHYVNVDDREGKSELVVVLRDRNTALLLKLAIG